MVDENTWHTQTFSCEGGCQIEYLVAVDPGLKGTGWAVWHSSSHVPVAVGVITPPRSADIGTRMHVVFRQLMDALSETRLRPSGRGTCTVDPRCASFAIEMPQYQESNVKGLGWKTGDLQKLTLLVGYLAHHHWHRVALITPRDWKGQLPKHVTEHRIRNILGEKACARLGIKTHAWDAVGIGLFVQGRF